MSATADRLRNGLIVSCHADETEPFFHESLLPAFALAAQLGGAEALRIEGIENIARLREKISIPIVGFVKGAFNDGADLITPELEDIENLLAAGADIVAIDATMRKRPDGSDGFMFFEDARKSFEREQLWADCSSFREGIRAAESGADFVATTLSGYIAPAPGLRVPDYGLIQELSSSLTIPVIAEGLFLTPESAASALACGAWAVVAGTAITRPRVVTRMFVQVMQKEARTKHRY